MSRILMTSLWAVSCHFYHREDGSDGSWRPPLLRCSISELSSFMSRCTLPCADTKVCHIILNDSWQLLIAWSFFRCWFFLARRSRNGTESEWWLRVIAVPVSHAREQGYWSSFVEGILTCHSERSKGANNKMTEIPLSCFSIRVLTSCMLGHCHAVTATGFFLITRQNACWWTKKCIIWWYN